jgi:hypothetical protein
MSGFSIKDITEKEHTMRAMLFCGFVLAVLAAASITSASARSASIFIGISQGINSATNTSGITLSRTIGNGGGSGLEGANSGSGFSGGSGLHTANNGSGFRAPLFYSL